jgi:hypothetical protein
MWNETARACREHRRAPLPLEIGVATLAPLCRSARTTNLFGTRGQLRHRAWAAQMFGPIWSAVRWASSAIVST